MKMRTKFVIFGAISALLMAAIYSSSSYIAFGKWNCDIPTAGPAGDEICTNRTNGKIVQVIYCYSDKDGKRQCIQVYAAKTDISPDLRNALNVTMQGTENNTKVPKVPKLGSLNDTLQ